ncbi:MAG: outer membrane lipoprotein carrier protein LolA [Rhodobacteraceae bacterium]|nr:outer membrane lipoprotein carrier protein LolA [Paracoccaceae bacterium]
MHRRQFMALSAAGAVASAFAGPARAELVPLNRISAYFNSIRTAQARFMQINGDGSRVSGQMFMHRPGRARFEYDPPERALVMAGGGQVAVFDGRSNERRPEIYPLNRTPLNLILERNVDLSSKARVVIHQEVEAGTVVGVRDPDNPDAGRIELLFSGSPIRLAQWVTLDAGGNRTRVILEDLVTGESFAPALFSITSEMKGRN